MNQRDLVRMLVMTGLFGANLLISEMAAGVSTLDVTETLQLAAMVVLWAGAYIIIGSAVCRRPILKSIPSMTLANIWAFVYGLGVIVFMTVCCTLATNAIITNNFIWLLSAVAMDDFLDRAADPLRRSGVLFAATTLSLVANTLILLADQNKDISGRGIYEGDWSTLAGGLFLPLVTPLLYGGVREKRHYSATTILELIHFAIPFAAILAVVILVTLHTNPADAPPRPPLATVITNYTLMGEVGTQTAARIVARVQAIQRSSYLIPLVPLTMLPTVYLAVQSSLLYTTTDFIVCVTFALAVRNLCHYPGVQDSAAAFALSTCALLARAYICVQDADSDSSRLYSSEEVEGGATEAPQCDPVSPGAAEDPTKPMLSKPPSRPPPIAMLSKV